MSLYNSVCTVSLLSIISKYCQPRNRVFTFQNVAVKLLCSQIPIHIFQEHLHQFRFFSSLSKQKGKEVLILFIPSNQGVLYGVKIGKAESFSELFRALSRRCPFFSRMSLICNADLEATSTSKFFVIRCIDLVDDLGQLLFHGFIHERPHWVSEG